jgi:dihydroorotase
MNWLLRGARVVDPSTGEDRIRDVRLVDGKIADEAAARDRGRAWQEVDCAGAVVAPGFVDLHATLSDPVNDLELAARGGFTTVLAGPTPAAPLDHPAAVRDLLHRVRASELRVLAAGGLTVGLNGREIADVGRLGEAGCAAYSHRSIPLPDARVTRHLLEYAGRFGRLVLLRAADAELDRSGVVREGPLASRLGLPGVPEEAEEIGVAMIAALVRRTGVPVHLTHMWTRRGVEAVHRALSEGLPITASTTVHHLTVDESCVEQQDYSGNTRFLPPLGDSGDRSALVAAVRDGWMAVASDHQPLPPEAKDREFELAEPGSVSFPLVWPLVLGALEGDIPATVRALSTRPAEILGRRASLAPGADADVVLLSSTVEQEVTAATFAPGPANSPLLGTRLRGAVLGVWVGGRPVFRAT